MNDNYVESTLSRAQVDSATLPMVLDFGAPWCGICAAAQPAIDGAFAGRANAGEAGADVDVDAVMPARIQIWDGPGKPLGRSFGIKLWPTLVFLKGGREVERLVRPTDSNAIAAALERLARASLQRTLRPGFGHVSCRSAIP